jgi:hypothetical protein
LGFYLCVLKPVTVLSARVNGAPADPYMAITYDGGNTGTATTVGTSGAPVPGNTVWFGTQAGGQERGTVRLRSWTPANATGTAGAFSIAENDDVGPYIEDDDYITVKFEWRLWGISPRLVQRGTEVEFYEDYSIGWTDQTTSWRPIAVAGPPAVEFGRGPVTVSFVGDRSFALASGATISTYLWTAHGSVEGTSSSQGTEGSPVTFTWTSPGQYLVSLQVTDSNGYSHTAYTFVFIVDPSDTDLGSGAYTQFDAYNDSHDFSRGGGECSFTVHGTADVSEFPREAMIVHAANGTQTTATGTWPFRANTLGVYYIVGNTIRQDSVNNTTSFRAVTIDGLMKNLSMHATSLRDEDGPANWTMASDITVDRAASFQMLWRSTLADMTPIVRLNYSAEIKRQDFAPTNLFAQLNNELVKDAWGQVVSSHQSVLHLTRDYNLMTTAERATVTTRKTLTKAIWLDPLDVEERPDYAWPVRKVKMSGIYYPGSQAEPVPYFSEAPGDVHKAFGREDAPGRLILSGQDDLNTRCGYALARQNYRWHILRGRFVNDGSFTVAPQEIFPATIEATDNNRGLSWEPDLIPRRMRRTYNHGGGYYTTEVEFEPSVTGPAGLTVLLPPVPPRDSDNPEYDPTPIPPWTPPVLPQAGAAVASDGAMGVYYTATKGATWERRVNGLGTGATGTSQLMFLDLIWDPWWFTPDRQATNDPEQVILWGCGPGFIVKTEDAAKHWQDLTPYLPDPDNSLFGISPAPTAADLTFKQIHADIHAIDTFYVIAEYLDVTQWYAWFYVTTDNGVTWDTYQIGNPAGGMECDATYCYAIYSSIENNTSAEKDVDASGVFSGDSGGTPTEFEQVYKSGGGYLGQFGIIADMNGIVSGSALTTNVHVKSDPADAVCNNGWWSGFNIDMQASLDGASWFAMGATTNWTDESGAWVWAGAATVNGAFRYIKLRSEPSFEAGDCDGWLMWIDSVRVSNILASAPVAGGNGRPLAMDLDTEDGSQLYLTYWGQDFGVIELAVFNTSDLNNAVRSLTLGTATGAEIEAQTYFAVPHTPHYPGTADFGDYAYAFGRWNNAGSVEHLRLSTDAAASSSDIGDGSWTTERVGGFRPDEETAGQTLYAFLNGTPATWRTLDAGTTWTSLGSNPFDVEFEAVSRMWGGSGDFLIGANAAASVQAAWLNSPYTDAWYDATGPAGQRLPTAADGGDGITAIIWI